MDSRYTKALTALAVAGAIAVPAVAQARGGSDDPANHEQRQHQVRHHSRHHRFDNDRRRHDRADNDRGDRRGSDDGPNHR
ncbi:MAG TPA: hypothetical protein VGF70_13385 [Solirubrobacteraceae bacterium]|jgi:hypothetical protein